MSVRFITFSDGRILPQVLTCDGWKACEVWPIEALSEKEAQTIRSQQPTCLLEHRRKHIDIVISKENEFVEVEDEHGKSIRVGEWVSQNDGCSVLRLTPKAFEQS